MVLIDLRVVLDDWLLGGGVWFCLVVLIVVCSAGWLRLFSGVFGVLFACCFGSDGCCWHAAMGFCLLWVFAALVVLLK